MSRNLLKVLPMLFSVGVMKSSSKSTQTTDPLKLACLNINKNSFRLYNWPHLFKSWITLSSSLNNRGLVLVVQTSDSAVHRINHYPADSIIDFRNTYPLDSDLSSG